MRLFWVQKIVRSNRTAPIFVWIAQLVEHKTENLRVSGSKPLPDKLFYLRVYSSIGRASDF